VIGDKRPYIAAVICIDYAVVGKWADERKINYTSYQELCQKPEVYDLVQKQIEESNKDLPEPARIHRLSTSTKSLTPTMKNSLEPANFGELLSRTDTRTL